MNNLCLIGLAAAWYLVKRDYLLKLVKVCSVIAHRCTALDKRTSQIVSDIYGAYRALWGELLHQHKAVQVLVYRARVQDPVYFFVTLRNTALRNTILLL